MRAAGVPATHRLLSQPLREKAQSAPASDGDRDPAEHHWDAAVIGAGPAGSAAAFVLAQAGWRVLLAERRARMDFKFGELLNPTVLPLLARMGIRAADLKEDHAPARGIMSSWASPAVEPHHFIFNPYGDGLRLDRPLFDRHLRIRAGEAGAELATGLRLEDVRLRDCWRLRFAGPDGAVQATARFLVDCTGRRSVVARHAGSSRTDCDRLFAVGVVYRPAAEDADPFLRIEALRQGWLYSLSLPSGGRIVIFHTDHDLPAARQAVEPDGFESILADSVHIGPLLSETGCAASTRPRAAAANGARLDQSFGPGWVAAGDAALSFDPLSSQGIMNAVQTGLAAAEALLKQHGGDEVALPRYAATLDAAHADYLQHHTHYYGLEQRWGDEPFWSRRHRSSAGPG